MNKTYGIYIEPPFHRVIYFDSKEKRDEDFKGMKKCRQRKRQGMKIHKIYRTEWDPSDTREEKRDTLNLESCAGHECGHGCLALKYNWDELGGVQTYYVPSRNE